MTFVQRRCNVLLDATSTLYKVMCPLGRENLNRERETERKTERIQVRSIHYLGHVHVPGNMEPNYFLLPRVCAELKNRV